MSSQAVAESDEELYFSELPIVASVSRLPQRLADAPTSVTVIDRALIKASGARDLNDVFRLVPGFQTFPNNTESARVTYHGLTDDKFSPRLQVLIDGRSQYSPAFQDGVNWLLMPVALEDIERIEIVRGTNNVSYGTNAFLGVVNIITVNPALAPRFSVSTNMGNQGVRDYSLRTSGTLGEMARFRFTYQQKDDDGLKDRADWQDSNHSRLLDLRTDVQLSLRDTLEINLGRSEATNTQGRLATTTTSGVTTVLDTPSLKDPLRDYDQTSTYGQLQWRRAIDDDHDLRLRYAFREDTANDAYVQQQADTFYEFNGTSWVGSNDYLVHINEGGSRSRTHELETQYSANLNDDWRSVMGASWRRDSLSSSYDFYGKSQVSRNISRVFSSIEWKPSAYFTGNMGLALEHDSVAGNHSSPRVSANFHLTPENTLRFGYSKAYRTGSLLDYLGDRRNVAYARADGTPLVYGDAYRRRLVGNPDLPAEKLETLEMGFLGDWRDWRMSFDLRVFTEHIPNRWMAVDINVDRSQCPSDPGCEDRYVGISPASVGRSPEFAAMLPIQDVRIRGLEYQWRWQPLDNTRLMVSQAFVHINSRVTVKTDSRGVITGTPYRVNQLSNASQVERTQDLTEQSSPTHSTSILLMQKLPRGFDLAVAGYWVGNSKWSRNSYNQSYQRYDLRLGYPFRWGKQRGEVAYTAQSINSHAEYQGAVYSNTPYQYSRVVDRRQWVSLRLDF